MRGDDEKRSQKSDDMAGSSSYLEIFHRGHCSLFCFPLCAAFLSKKSLKNQ